MCCRGYTVKAAQLARPLKGCAYTLTNCAKSTFDRIFVDEGTNSTGLFYIYVRTAGAAKGKVEITFFNPKNKPVAQASYRIEVKEESIPLDRPVHVQFFGRIGFGVKERGTCWVDVTHNGESLGGRDLTISDPLPEGKADERNSSR